MKTFKKADTFGRPGEWQISKEDRELIGREVFCTAPFTTLSEEDIDEVVAALIKLEFVKIED